MLLRCAGGGREDNDEMSLVGEGRGRGLVCFFDVVSVVCNVNRCRFVVNGL